MKGSDKRFCSLELFEEVMRESIRGIRPALIKKLVRRTCAFLARFKNALAKAIAAPDAKQRRRAKTCVRTENPCCKKMGVVRIRAVT